MEKLDKNPGLEFLRSNSLSSILEREIERIILTGTFKSGDWLNENALAARFKVSRGPVREACRALAQKGLLELIPNRGVFVRHIGPPEAEECYDLRSGLFSLAARLLAEKIDDGELAVLAALVDDMDAAAARSSLKDYAALNLRFHEHVVRGAGNKRLVDTYTGLINELHLFRARGLLHVSGMVASNQEHRDIVAALQARDPVNAAEVAYHHVQNGKRRMLAVVNEEEGDVDAASRSRGA